MRRLNKRLLKNNQTHVILFQKVALNRNRSRYNNNNTNNKDEKAQ